MRGPTLKLYGHVNHLSPNTFKVRVALLEVDVAFEYVAVDLGKGEQHTPEFLGRNPHGKIPVLEEDDFALPESDAILFYLAERYPESKLMGSTVRERARALQWCHFASSTLYSAYFDVYYHSSSGPQERRVPEMAEAGQKKFDRALGVMDKVLADRSFLADEFSIGDIACASVLRAARGRVAYAPEAHTPTESWYGRVTSRRSWKAALER